MWSAIPVIEPDGAADFIPEYGKICEEAGAISGRGIVLGVDACLKGEAGALVTAPSCKEALHLAGYRFPGQTEMLADLTGSPDHVMILTTGKFHVGLATTHCALKDVSQFLNLDLIRRKINVLHKTMVGWFRLTQPRIGVCSMNPHASDGGIFGSEEAEIIRPAIESARNSGILVEGPLPADTLFPRRREYGAILAMYHDQGMIPIKMAGFGRAVNLTGGLPFPRTSPDHGTAFDIAGKFIADHHSMLLAVRMAFQMLHIRNKLNDK